MSRKDDLTHSEIIDVNTRKSEIINNDTNTNKTISNFRTSVDDTDYDKTFESEEDIADLLEDISQINWSDDIFSDINSLSEVDHTSDFKGNYHFSKDMDEILHVIFGLENFRPGQREIINAILEGHDCFVLMLTGGGKSLCYQLPAVLSKGVTVVISPLIALITDQVDKLSALDIRAAHLCSTLKRYQEEDVFSKLLLTEPEIDILYLTPEKIMGSNKTIIMLESLYKSGNLARFIFDEVHCLSLWGHDFRPHYKKLSILKDRYNGIQIVCFTATATKQVETDVIVNLNLRNVKRFIKSFNRPNIKYQVIEKLEKMPVFDIARLINKKFFRQSGIIYCLTRKDCVNLSRYLKIMGISAKPYHAGLHNNVREKTQREWMQDQFHVIVATIAFGMGIDKPDVRFVIHNTIPKSLEAYYQESGRAGRDGEVSYSYLFYYYADVLRTMRLMSQDFSRKNTLQGHLDNLEQVVAFANNQLDCRRYLQLLNLGENFDRQLCLQNRETTCDNCENLENRSKHEINVTKHAKELCVLVKDITERNVTLIVITKIYQGSKEKAIIKYGLHKHKYCGSGRLMSKLDIHRILRNLIQLNVLANHYITTGDFPVVYIKPGAKLNTFLESTDMTLKIPIASTRSFQTEQLTSQQKTPAEESITAGQDLINKIKTNCYECLSDFCRRLALDKDVSVSSILHPFAIRSISELLPATREEFLRIQHVTAAIYNKFGEEILNLVRQFKEQILAIQNSTISVFDSGSNADTRKRTFTDAFS